MNAPFAPDAPDRIRAALAAAPVPHFIDGKACPSASGATFAVLDPATGAQIAEAAAGDAATVDAAVAAARRAFEGPWRRTPPAERARLMLKLAQLIEAEAATLAITESLDNGMPFGLARFGSVGGAIEQLRYNAGWATKLNGETITPSAPGEWHSFTVREPIGVVAGIVPWNFPFVMAVAKIAPALAAGCTVVLKPAEQAPLTAARLGALVAEAGFPEGVVNIVLGLGEAAGAALVAHRGVDKISFTGSTQVGKAIVRACADDLKRVTLELGGKSPVIVFGDADLERAIPSVAMGIFGNSGQVCAAGSRLFVHESVYDRLVEGVCARARDLKVGPGLAPGTEMGPLVSDEQRERVLGYIESGLAQGAGIAVGGGAIAGAGYFVEPTVLTGTAAGMRVVDEEIFGPVLCAMRFGDDDLDAIAERANATRYGLAASIWTRDISTALRLSRRVRAGTVRVNGGGGVDPAVPLGGFAESGWGRENGRPGVEAFTELKSVTVAL
jgi:phenylacetaldehyde dehydrogenase